MGYWKERLIEESESGLVAGAADDKFVCADCFRDTSLRNVVTDAIASEACTFCGATCDDGIAAPLEALVDHISQCVHRHYEDAANSLPYDSAEGGYQWSTLDTWEVLDAMGLEDAVSEGREDLVEAIRDSFEMAGLVRGRPLRPEGARAAVVQLGAILPVRQARAPLLLPVR